MSFRRSLPNILIAGTPGTGKSTLSGELCDRAALEWINVGEVARRNQLYVGYDEELDSHVLDEEKLFSEIEDKVLEGGKVVDYHACDLFPEEWFDVVIILQTDNTLLYDRLVRRGYSKERISSNVQCEIFETTLEEAKASYNPNIVFSLVSNTPDDMEDNLEKLCMLVEEWKNKDLKR